jgi:hypothetical protein
VNGKLKGLSNKPDYTQDLDLYCRSYGDQRNSFHLRAGRAIQKTSSNIFFEDKRKLCHVRKVHTYKGSFGSFHSD